MLRAVVLTQYRRVTDRQTDGITVASTALAMLALRHAVKNSTFLATPAAGEIRAGMEEGNEAPPPCQISPPSVQRVAPAGPKTSKSASE